MSTIEDKILDGPQVHYCDAEDDDIRHDEFEDSSESRAALSRENAASLFTRPNDEEEARLNRLGEGKSRCTGSTNTGPKGVIEDYIRQAKAKNGESQTSDIDNIEREFQDLFNDESILKEYIAKRINKAIEENTSTFGQLYHLRTGDELLEAIDNENENVLVIVHIYTKYLKSCANLNRCLGELASSMYHIKFLTLDASVAGLSQNFKDNGVPALLAYKKGELVKSLVQLEELLDKNFDTDQVKALLIENGLIN